MSTPPGFKLDKDLVTALFEEVEKSNVSRHEFDLYQLVNAKSFLFGEAGSEKRRAVQKQFAEAKRKSDHQYLKFLAKVGVSPGEFLKGEILAGKDAGKKETPKRSRESKEDSSSEYESDSDDSDSEDSTSTKPKPVKRPKPTEDKQATKEKEEATPKKPMKSKPAQIPPVNIEIPANTAPKKMHSDTETETSTAESSNSYYVGSICNVASRVEILEKPEFRQDGSKEYPYIIIANPDRPETCHGFEVALVPQVKVGNFVRSVYHIRHVTTQGMEDEWSATIPREEFPSLANRSVLIRGPSQELWHRRPDLYHEEPFCAQTAIVHEAQQTALKQSIVRLYSYWLLVLPKGTMLENYIISHDSVHVLKGTQEMAVAFDTEDENGTESLETLYGMDVYWRIAEAGGNMVTDPGHNTTKKRRKKKQTTKK